jgi:L-2-hydroxyglutarate oxidase LhgO
MARGVDIAVVGGGIVGLATAYALTGRYPELKLALFEKERQVAAHQTGHNSGVVHSGIYYRPGSLKARLCVSGVKMMEAFCKEHGLPYDRCGKVIVAGREDEVPTLQMLLERGQENGVPGLRLIDAGELRTIEPHAAGVQAIHAPETAIADYRQVAQKLRELLEARGVVFYTGTEVTAVHEDGDGLAVRTENGQTRSRFLINCAGLYADRVARLAGATPEVRIVPFRGEYYFLKADKRHLVRGLIYPVPNPELPFLGVHFTKTVHGEIESGPNAVFALAREGYRHRDIVADELLETLSYAGFWKLAARYWKVGLFEVYRSLSKAAFVRSLQQLVPSITPEDVVRGGAGVRAQAVDEMGKLVDDFATLQSPRALHVLNAPSPAATASLAIGEHLGGLARESFGL